MSCGNCYWSMCMYSHPLHTPHTHQTWLLNQEDHRSQYSRFAQEGGSNTICEDNTKKDTKSIQHGLNHSLMCLTHKTFPFDTPSILVPFSSRWAWCAIMHFAKSVIHPGLDSKTHTSALVSKRPWGNSRVSLIHQTSKTCTELSQTAIYMYWCMQCISLIQSKHQTNEVPLADWRRWLKVTTAFILKVSIQYTYMPGINK